VSPLEKWDHFYTAQQLQQRQAQELVVQYLMDLDLGVC
jgi:hypothetical protein